MEKPYALVLGLKGSNPLGVVRSLGLGSVPVLGMHIGSPLENRIHAYYSRYLNRSLSRIIPSESDLLEQMIRFGESQDKKAVIFPTCDEYVVFCFRNQKVLQRYFHVPMLPVENPEEFLEKSVNNCLGLKAGFNLPKSAYLSEFNCHCDTPLIVKPLTSITFGKSEMRRYENGQRLIEEKDALLQRFQEMVVQEFVPGGVENMFEVNVYQSSKGPIISGMQKRLLGFEEAPGVYTAVISESVWLDSLVTPSERLARNLRYNMPLNIDLKLSDLDLKFYFLEVNLRTGANLFLDTMSGLNLPLIVYYDLTAIDFHPLTIKNRVLGARLYDEEIKPFLDEEKRKKLRDFLKSPLVKVLQNKEDNKPSRVFARTRR